MPPVGNLTCNPGMCSDWESISNLLIHRPAAPNPLSHTSQGYWLILVCALTRDQTHNLGVRGQLSNQMSYQARAYDLIFVKKKTKTNTHTNTHIYMCVSVYRYIHYKGPEQASFWLKLPSSSSLPKKTNTKIKRRGTRFRPSRKHEVDSLATYVQIYKEGDIVDIEGMDSG